MGRQPCQGPSWLRTGAEADLKKKDSPGWLISGKTTELWASTGEGQRLYENSCGKVPWPGPNSKLASDTTVIVEASKFPQHYAWPSGYFHSIPSPPPSPTKQSLNFRAPPVSAPTLLLLLCFPALSLLLLPHH